MDIGGGLDIDALSRGVRERLVAYEIVLADTIGEFDQEPMGLARATNTA
jgi:hypothetical protein